MIGQHDARVIGQDARVIGHDASVIGQDARVIGHYASVIGQQDDARNDARVIGRHNARDWKT